MQKQNMFNFYKKNLFVFNKLNNKKINKLFLKKKFIRFLLFQQYKKNKLKKKFNKLYNIKNFISLIHLYKNNYLNKKNFLFSKKKLIDLKKIKKDNFVNKITNNISNSANNINKNRNDRRNNYINYYKKKYKKYYRINYKRYIKNEDRFLIDHVYEFDLNKLKDYIFNNKFYYNNKLIRWFAIKSFYDKNRYIHYPSFLERYNCFCLNKRIVRLYNFTKDVYFSFNQLRKIRNFFFFSININSFFTNSKDFFPSVWTKEKELSFFWRFFFFLITKWSFFSSFSFKNNNLLCMNKNVYHFVCMNSSFFFELKNILFHKYSFNFFSIINNNFRFISSRISKKRALFQSYFPNLSYFLTRNILSLNKYGLIFLINNNIINIFKNISKYFTFSDFLADYFLYTTSKKIFFFSFFKKKKKILKKKLIDLISLYNTFYNKFDLSLYLRNKKKFVLYYKNNILRRNRYNFYNKMNNNRFNFNSINNSIINYDRKNNINNSHYYRIYNNNIKKNNYDYNNNIKNNNINNTNNINNIDYYNNQYNNYYRNNNNRNNNNRNYNNSNYNNRDYNKRNYNNRDNNNRDNNNRNYNNRNYKKNNITYYKKNTNNNDRNNNNIINNNNNIISNKKNNKNYYYNNTNNNNRNKNDKNYNNRNYNNIINNNNINKNIKNNDKNNDINKYKNNEDNNKIKYNIKYNNNNIINNNIKKNNRKNNNVNDSKKKKNNNINNYKKINNDNNRNNYENRSKNNNNVIKNVSKNINNVNNNKNKITDNRNNINNNNNYYKKINNSFHSNYNKNDNYERHNKSNNKINNSSTDIKEKNKDIINYGTLNKKINFNYNNKNSYLNKNNYHNFFYKRNYGNYSIKYNNNFFGNKYYLRKKNYNNKKNIDNKNFFFLKKKNKNVEIEPFSIYSLYDEYKLFVSKSKKEKKLSFFSSNIYNSSTFVKTIPSMNINFSSQNNLQYLNKILLEMGVHLGTEINGNGRFSVGYNEAMNSYLLGFFKIKHLEFIDYYLYKHKVSFMNHIFKKGFLFNQILKYPIINIQSTLFVLKQAVNFIFFLGKKGGRILFFYSDLIKNPGFLLFMSGVSNLFGHSFNYMPWIFGAASNYYHMIRYFFDKFFFHISIIKRRIKGYSFISFFLRVLFLNIVAVPRDILFIAHNKKMFIYWKVLIFFRYFSYYFWAPDVIIGLNPKGGYSGITEYGSHRLPTISAVDTNGTFKGITYAIPSNDDSLAIVLFFFNLFINSYEKGRLNRYSSNFSDIIYK